MALAKARAANAAYSPSYVPVAVFLGGTSGIGRAMAESLARYTNGNVRILIVGRNKAAADKIISSFPKPADPTAESTHDFVSCDATLMSNCQTATTHIVSKYPKINFLVLSSGVLSFKGRNETAEGIDKVLALHYYARWKFINDLLPSLRRAKEEGEDAKVLSIYGAGKGGEIDVDDLGLKKGYSSTKALSTAPTYNDLMMEEFASHDPQISFAHIYPGAVRTPIASSLHWSTKPLVGLLYPFMVPAGTCAEYMWSAVFAAKEGSSRWGAKGDDLGKTKYFGTEEQRRRLWEHTVEATRV